MQDRVLFLEAREINVHQWMVMILMGILEARSTILGEDVVYALVTYIMSGSQYWKGQ